MNLKLIGAKIRESRQAMNMTQEKLAEKLDISTSFLSRMENGVSVAGFETYCQICEALDITLDYLTQNEILPAKKKQCEIIFSNAIRNMDQKQIDYVLNIIKTFCDYLDKSM